MPNLSQTITSKLIDWKVAGISVAAICGAAITISYIMTNRLQAKYYNAELKKLTAEGYGVQDALDKVWAEIEGAAGKQGKTAKVATTTPPMTPVASADGEMMHPEMSHFQHAVQEFGNPVTHFSNWSLRR